MPVVATSDQTPPTTALTIIINHPLDNSTQARRDRSMIAGYQPLQAFLTIQGVSIPKRAYQEEHTV